MRLAKRLAAGFLVAVSAILCASAEAHIRSQSRSSWMLSDVGATAVFVTSSYDATRLIVDEPFERLANVYATHLLRTLTVSRGGRGCKLDHALPLAAERGFVRVEVVVSCDVPGIARVRIDSFFGSAPSHVHIADVRVAGGGARDFLFTEGSREHVFGSTSGAVVGSADSVTAALRRYVRLGTQHIVAGPDHLAFLVALVLLCNGLGSVVWMVTGFTIGHSLTLAAAVLGLVDADAGAIEVLIGFTIAVASVEGTVRDAPTARRAALGCACALGATAVFAGLAGWRVGTFGWLALAVFACCHLFARADVSRSRAVNVSLSAVFGLVHGFGFANVLVDMDLPAHRLAPALAGFNVGVELGQLAVVAGLWACLLAARRVLGAESHRNMAEHATAMLCGLGVYWMISRSLNG